MWLKKVIVRHFKEFVPLLVLADVPVVLLIDGLVKTNTLQHGIDAWQGKFVHPLMGTFIINPWLNILPLLCGLLLVYVALSWAGVGVVHYVRPETLLGRKRTVIGLALGALGAFSFFVATVVASWTWNEFVNRNFLGGPAHAIPTLIIPSLMALLVNIYQTINANRVSSPPIPSFGKGVRQLDL